MIAALYVATGVADRLMARVQKRADGCWLWLGAVNGKGYGTIFIGVGKSPQYVHRVSWALENGRVPDGMCVCHRCDVPRCVNPAHLFLGTLADNNADMRAKGRARYVSLRGEASPTSKLSDDDRARIRAIPASVSGELVAAEFGISRTTVSRLRRGVR